MKKPRRQFEPEVHSGILAIICLLLLLNFASNFVAYKAWSLGREALTREMRAAGIQISRAAQEEFPIPLSAQKKADLRARYDLSALILVSSRPEESPENGYRKWFNNLARMLPEDQLPGVAEKLLRQKYHQLSRGNGSHFFYVYPMSLNAGPDLLILGSHRPDLAYLDESREYMATLIPGGLVAVLVIYLLLSRFIFSPFRKIREQAIRAGRNIDGEENDAEAIASEYERVISSLKQNETELWRLNSIIQNRAEALEQMNQYLLDSSSLGVITMDDTGKVLSMNGAASELLVLDEKTSVGQSYCGLLDHYPELVDQITPPMKSELFPGYTEVTLTPRGREAITIGLTVSPIRDINSRMVGVSVFLNDLTELTALRREVEQKGRLAALGEMAGGLAHQLRNSMGAISGFGTLVKRKLAGTGLSLQNVESLLQETAEAEDMIKRFLSFAGPFCLEPSTTDLRALLEEIVESFRVRQDSATIEFTVVCSGDQSINADAALLKQVFANVIDNCVHACSANGGRIQVESVRSDSDVVVEIKDTGVGIAESDLDKIFTPFFSSRPGGTGLGLPMAGKIINLHGGRITVDSILGKGTKYQILLPLLNSQSIRRAQPASV